MSDPPASSGEPATRRRARRLAGRSLVLVASCAVLATLGISAGVRRGRATVSWQHEILAKSGYPSDEPGALSVSRAGVAFLLGDTLYRVDPSGTKHALKSPAVGSFTAGSLNDAGDGSFAFYRRRDAASSELHLARVTRHGTTRFDVALGERRDDTCGTGWTNPAVATHGSVTWVSAMRDDGTVLLAFDETGQEISRVDEPCTCASKPCSCSVGRLRAYPGGVVVTSSSEDSQGTEYLWFDRHGTLEGKIRGVSEYFRTFDRHGAFQRIVTGPLSGCRKVADDGVERLARLERSGCSVGPPLPPELFTGVNVIGMGATRDHVYVATDDQLAPSWKLRLRGVRGDDFRAVIHRFARDGRYLDSRWASASRPVDRAGAPSWNGLHVIDDEHLTFLLRLPRDEPAGPEAPRPLFMLGLRY